MSAEKFLAYERHRGPACLVLEVAIPRLDGLEVQKRLRQCWPELVVVFLTGHGDIPTSVRAIKPGAEDSLTKPVNAGILLRAVQAALQRASDSEGRARATGGPERAARVPHAARAGGA